MVELIQLMTFFIIGVRHILLITFQRVLKARGHVTFSNNVIKKFLKKEFLTFFLLVFSSHQTFNFRFISRILFFTCFLYILFSSALFTLWRIYLIQTHKTKIVIRFILATSIHLFHTQSIHIHIDTGVWLLLHLNCVNAKWIITLMFT